MIEPFTKNKYQRNMVTANDEQKRYILKHSKKMVVDDLAANTGLSADKVMLAIRRIGGGYTTQAILDKENKLK